MVTALICTGVRSLVFDHFLCFIEETVPGYDTMFVYAQGSPDPDRL